jgi:hypothetical protein
MPRTYKFAVEWRLGEHSKPALVTSFIGKKSRFGGTDGASLTLDEAKGLRAQSLAGELPSGVQGFMESYYGRRFGDVRIHTGREAAAAAEAIQAKAFTHGKDIYFGRGQYDPKTAKGLALLGHELAHVVQGVSLGEGGVDVETTMSEVEKAIEKAVQSGGEVDLDLLIKESATLGDFLDNVFKRRPLPKVIEDKRKREEEAEKVSAEEGAKKATRSRGEHVIQQLETKASTPAVKHVTKFAKSVIKQVDKWAEGQGYKGGAMDALGQFPVVLKVINLYKIYKAAKSDKHLSEIVRDTGASVAGMVPAIVKLTATNPLLVQILGPAVGVIGAWFAYRKKLDETLGDEKKAKMAALKKLSAVGATLGVIAGVGALGGAPLAAGAAALGAYYGVKKFLEWVEKKYFKTGDYEAFTKNLGDYGKLYDEFMLASHQLYLKYRYERIKSKDSEAVAPAEIANLERLQQDAVKAATGLLDAESEVELSFKKAIETFDAIKVEGAYKTAAKEVLSVEIHDKFLAFCAKREKVWTTASLLLEDQLGKAGVHVQSDFWKQILLRDFATDERERMARDMEVKLTIAEQNLFRAEVLASKWFKKGRIRSHLEGVVNTLNLVNMMSMMEDPYQLGTASNLLLTELGLPRQPKKKVFVERFRRLYNDIRDICDKYGVEVPTWMAGKYYETEGEYTAFKRMGYLEESGVPVNWTEVFHLLGDMVQRFKRLYKSFPTTPDNFRDMDIKDLAGKDYKQGFWNKVQDFWHSFLARGTVLEHEEEMRNYFAKLDRLIAKDQQSAVALPAPEGLEGSKREFKNYQRIVSLRERLWNEYIQLPFVNLPPEMMAANPYQPIVINAAQIRDEWRKLHRKREMISLMAQGASPDLEKFYPELFGKERPKELFTKALEEKKAQIIGYIRSKSNKEEAPVLDAPGSTRAVEHLHYHFALPRLRVDPEVDKFEGTDKYYKVLTRWGTYGWVLKEKAEITELPSSQLGGLHKGVDATTLDLLAKKRFWFFSRYNVKDDERIRIARSIQSNHVYAILKLKKGKSIDAWVGGHSHKLVENDSDNCLLLQLSPQLDTISFTVPATVAEGGTEPPRPVSPIAGMGFAGAAEAGLPITNVTYKGYVVIGANEDGLKVIGDRKTFVRQEDVTIVSLAEMEAQKKDAMGRGFREGDEIMSGLLAENLLGGGLGLGQSLDLSTRMKLERLLGISLEGVRIYTGDRAAQAAESLEAQAFTIGSNIVFAQGKFNPDSPEGLALLAHEATHVKQQHADYSRGYARPTPRAMEESATAQEGKVLYDRRGSYADTVSKTRREMVFRDRSVEQSASAAPQPQSLEPVQRQPMGRSIGFAQQSEENRQRGEGEDPLLKLMDRYGIKPEITEEEFMDELTDRVMGLMKDEVVLEIERRENFSWYDDMIDYW